MQQCFLVGVWLYDTCRDPVGQASCSSYLSCSTCNLQSNCGQSYLAHTHDNHTSDRWFCLTHSMLFLASGWCGNGRCVDGFSSKPFSQSYSGCASNYYFTTSFSCSTSLPAQNGGTNGCTSCSTTGNPSGEPSTITPRVAGNDYPSKAKAAFPLLFIVLAIAISGFSFFCCMPRYHPKQGSRVIVGVPAVGVMTQEVEHIAHCTLTQFNCTVLVSVGHSLLTRSFLCMPLGVHDPVLRYDVRRVCVHGSLTHSQRV